MPKFTILSRVGAYVDYTCQVEADTAEEVDKSAPKRWRADAAAEKAEAFRKGR
ncbi:hypothetical protein [Brevundimonas sp.]|uniref:hypothetical protein n=1 Tax=Brevundimonas sp. TaxID=1871086 RepID=UPI003AF54591